MGPKKSTAQQIADRLADPRPLIPPTASQVSADDKKSQEKHRDIEQYQKEKFGTADSTNARTQTPEQRAETLKQISEEEKAKKEAADAAELERLRSPHSSKTPSDEEVKDVEIVDTTDGVQTDEVQTIIDMIAALPEDKQDKLLAMLLDDTDSVTAELEIEPEIETELTGVPPVPPAEVLPGPYKAPGAGGTALAKLIADLSRHG
jgi:hypothetical protein